MNDESAIQDAIRLRLGQEPDVCLWRNNCGTAEHWNGRRVERVRYGLCEGSSDLVGVLAPSGRLLALEVKTATGRPTKEQLAFLALVRRMGGFAAVVRSVDEAMAAVARARTGVSE